MLYARSKMNMIVNVAERIPDALNILDRFHIMKMFNDAIDETRKQEVYALQAHGYENILHKSKWCLLKNPRNWNQSLISTTQMVHLSHYK